MKPSLTKALEIRPRILLLTSLLLLCLLVSSCVPAKGYIVTYNMVTHRTINGTPWRQRLDNFVNDIVVPYRPGIIGLQEVYLRATGISCCGNPLCGENIGQGEYLGYLIENIKSRTGTQYYVANALKDDHAVLGCFFAEEWEGIAVLYDPSQVRLVPYDRDNGVGGECKNWWQPQLQEERNDCLLLSVCGNKCYKVSTSLFEFPIGSGNYILFFNTHASTSDPSGDVDRAVSFMHRQDDNYGDYSTCPPILVGDLNTWETPTIQANFLDPFAGTEHIRHIDNILFGIPDTSIWKFDNVFCWIPNSDYLPKALAPFDPEHYIKANPGDHEPSINVVTGHTYSDHPVYVVEVTYLTSSPPPAPVTPTPTEEPPLQCPAGQTSEKCDHCYPVGGHCQ